MKKQLKGLLLALVLVAGVQINAAARIDQNTENLVPKRARMSKSEANMALSAAMHWVSIGGVTEALAAGADPNASTGHLTLFQNALEDTFHDVFFGEGRVDELSEARIKILKALAMAGGNVKALELDRFEKVLFDEPRRFRNPELMQKTKEIINFLRNVKPVR